MSRSKKKYPIGSVCVVTAGEMKNWKKSQNRKLRRNKIDLEDGGFYKKISDIWDSPSDGKAYYCDNPKAYRK